MKKSELYHEAMRAVVRSAPTVDVALEVLAVLMEDKKMAEYYEKHEAKKKQEKEAADNEAV